MRGQAHKLGDDINTDYIISGKNKRDTFNPQEMVKHLFEDIDPTLAMRIKCGDIIVAGSNFGCGSSREAAPQVIKTAGIRAVLAKSFARIFFRNGINIGLPLLICDTTGIEEGDVLEIDLENGIIQNITRNKQITFSKLPSVMADIFQEGGLVNYLRKNQGFVV